MPLLYPPFPSPTLPRLLSHWQVATGCPLLSWAWRSSSTWRVYGPSGTINMSRLLASAARRQHCCVGVCVSVVGVVSLHKMTYEAHNWNFKGDGAQSGHKLGGWSALAKVSRARWWQQSRGGQRERHAVNERKRDRERDWDCWWRASAERLQDIASSVH